MGWLRGKFTPNHASMSDVRPTIHDDYEIAIRVEDALARAEEAARIAHQHTVEAQQLYGTVRRELSMTKQLNDGKTP